MAEPDKDQKTEEATPRRRQEAREKGQVAMSTEFVAAMMMLCALGTWTFAGPSLAEAAGECFVLACNDVPSLALSDMDTAQAGEIMMRGAKVIALPFSLLVLPMLVIGALVGYGQVGFQIAPKAVSFDLNKLDPMKGFGRMFSARSFMRTLLAALKISVVVTTIGLIAWDQVPRMSALIGGDVWQVLGGLIAVLARCAIGALVAIIVLSVIDLVFQRVQHAKDLRMSKQELKEEYKTTEGDPHLKARIRQIQRDLATRRMMDDVPGATVVVTNPTHYAVAIQYDRSVDALEGRAPRVVAKGVDHVAQRIKKVASEAGVILYEDVPLARALHAQVEIGDQIPEDLFHAVAQVLSYVFRMKGESVTAGV